MIHFIIKTITVPDRKQLIIVRAGILMQRHLFFPMFRHTGPKIKATKTFLRTISEKATL